MTRTMDHDAGHDFGADGDASEATISVFSTKVIGTMLMGFGAAGAIARSYDMGYLGSSLVGLVTGAVLAA